MASFNTGGILFVHGAYGRPAKKEDWDAGKDMRIVFGPYCSIRDVPRMKEEGYTHVVIQNNMMMQNIDVVCVIKLD